MTRTTALGTRRTGPNSGRRERTRLRRGAQTWRRWLSAAAACAVAVSGMVVSVGDAPAAAATGTGAGQITIDEPNPVSQIELGPTFQQQFVSRTLGGKAFYSTAGNIEAYPVVVDLESGKAESLPGPSEQTHGGTGTAADPFYLETSAPFPAGPLEGVRLTQRLSYVMGTEYMRNDIVLVNEGGELRNLQVGQYADCFFGGKDEGFSAVFPDEMVQCVADDYVNAMSLIALSPGAAFAGGHYIGVLTAMGKPLVGAPHSDQCWVNASNVGRCDIRLDNGFGMAWAVELPPGATETRSGYLSYTSDLRFVHLDVAAELDQSEVWPGEEVTYLLSVTNRGPDTAVNSSVAFALPDGVELAATLDAYDAAAGVWSVPELAPGESESIEIGALAIQPGTFVTQITATSSDGIDASPCQNSGTCGSPLELIVRTPGSAAQSLLTAAPPVLQADGVEASTLTVQAMSETGEPAPIGGAQVELTTTLGVLSEVIDQADGSYTATLRSTEAGTAEVGLLIDGVPSPSTARVEFLPGPVDLTAAESSYTVSPGVLAVDRGSHTLSVTLVDELGNRVPGQGGALSADSSDSLGQGTVGEFEEGTVRGDYVARISSTVPGEKRVHVEFAGASVALAGNGVATFSSGSADPEHDQTHFTVSSGTQEVGQGAHTITVMLRDEFGNPVPGAADSLAASSPAGLGQGSAGAFEETGITGVYETTVTSTLSGIKPIEVMIDGIPLAAEGNAHARFTHGSVDLSHAASGFSVSAGDVSVSDGAHSVTVTLRDAYGNPVAGAAARLAVGAHFGSSQARSTGFVESDTPGDYTASLSAQVAGAYFVIVTLDEVVASARGNDTAQFVAGAVSLEHPGTGFVVSEGEAVVGSGAHTVTVTLVDHHGNPVAGHGGALAAVTPVGLGTGEIGPFTADEAPGVYNAEVTSTLIGEKQLRVMLEGGSVRADGNDIASFIAAPVDVTNQLTGFEVTAGDRTVGDEPHTVTVTLGDRFGNPVSGRAAELAATATAELGEGTISGFHESMLRGTYTAAVSATSAGSKSIEVTLAEQELLPRGNAIARFVASFPDTFHPSTHYVVSVGERSVIQGVHGIRVSLVDEYGNPVSGAHGQLVTIMGEDLGIGRIDSFAETDEPGIYWASITSTVSGYKTVQLSLGQFGPVMGKGNIRAHFIPGPVDVNGYGTGYRVSAGERPAGGAPHTITASLADVYGNRVAGAEADLLATAVGELGEGAISGFREGNFAGEYVATIEATVPGTKTVSVSHEGTALEHRGNVDARFGPAELDPEHPDTTFSVSSGELVVGEAEHRITVSLSDRFGNPLEGAANELAAGTDAELGDGQLTEFRAGERAGEYLAAVSSTVAGAKPIAVTAWGTAVAPEGNDTARFVAGEVDPANGQTSFRVSEGAVVAGSGSHTITVGLVDRYGNPHPGAAEKLTASTEDPVGDGALSAFTETATQGTYAARITSTVAGAKTVTVRHGTTPIHADGPEQALFIAGEVDPAHAETTYEVTLGEVSVDGGAHAITARLVDALGNPVGGEAAALSADAEQTLGAGHITGFVETEAPGSYVASVTSTRAGGKTLVVSFNDTALATERNTVARFVSGGASVESADTWFSVSRGDQIAGEGAHTVTVALSDDHGNPVAGQADGLSGEAIGATVRGEVTRFNETEVSGTYLAEIRATTAGDYRIAVAFGGNTVAHRENHTARFVPGAVNPTARDAGFVVTTGPAVVGESEHRIAVTLVDAHSNPVPGQAGDLNAAAAEELGDGAISGFTETDEVGRYEAAVTATLAGNKQVTVLFGDTELSARGNDTAWFVAATPDPDHEESGFRVSEGGTVVGTAPHTVTVTLVDPYGNPAEDTQSALAAATRDELGAGRISAFAPAADPGSYAAEVTATRAGEKRLTVALGELSLTPLGNDIAHFTAGAPALDAITLSAPPRIRADGVDTATLTATLFDDFGNIPEPPLDVRLDTTRGVISETTAIGSGQFTAQLTATEPGVAHISVSVNGERAPIMVEVHLLENEEDGTGGGGDPDDDRDGDAAVEVGGSSPGGPGLPITGAPVLWLLGVTAVLLCVVGRAFMNRGARRRAR